MLGRKGERGWMMIWVQLRADMHVLGIQLGIAMPVLGLNEGTALSILGALEEGERGCCDLDGGVVGLSHPCAIPGLVVQGAALAVLGDGPDGSRSICAKSAEMGCPSARSNGSDSAGASLGGCHACANANVTTNSSNMSPEQADHKSTCVLTHPRGLRLQVQDRLIALLVVVGSVKDVE